MRNKKLFILLGISLLHSMLILFVTFWILEKNYTYGDETFLIKWSSIFKKIILNIDSKPPLSDFLFVNTSYDNMLIDKLDDDGLSLGNQVITDREKLAKFLEIINKQPERCKYILCDIFFENESPNDEELNRQLIKTKNIIIPYMQDESGKVTYPIFNINKGLAIYNKISNSFLKYTLLRDDSLKSVPLKMYEDIYKSTFNQRGIFSFMNNKLSLNNIIIDFKIRYYDILEGKSPNPYPYINLGEVLSLPDSIILKSVKDRIVLIGDLKDRDIHNTAIGEMPGVLIMLNTFLVLKNGENNVKLPMLIILFLTYFLISIDVFASKSFSEREIIQNLTNNKIGKFFVKFLGYVMFLSVISVIIYFFNNVHINILIIAVYFKTLDSLLRHFRKEPESHKQNIFSKIRLRIYKILNQ